MYDQHAYLLHKELQAYGMEWSHRTFKLGVDTYLIGANTLILPYNYQNIVQHSRPTKLELQVENFYFDDSYLLDGQIHMHKFQNYPVQLEMMLDQYWKQRPLAILQVFLKTKTEQKKTTLAEAIVSQRITSNSNDLVKTVRNKDGSVQTVVYGNDTLQNQIDHSGDRLINKILHYLSRLPNQFSNF